MSSSQEDKHYILKDLTGTQQSVFKLGEHKLKSDSGKFLVADRDGPCTLLEVSTSKLKINNQAFYWGWQPFEQGNHQAGDIVWNVNPNGDRNILCWRCVESGEPGVWIPQYVAKPLPSSSQEGAIAQYFEGEWIGTSLEDLTISTSQIVETRSKKFVTADQLKIINDTKGINSGDETYSSIRTKLGSATSFRDGYLSNTDFDKIQAAYNVSIDLLNNPFEVNVPTKLSELFDDIQVITKDQLPLSLSQLENDAGYITLASLPTKVSQLENDLGYVQSVSLPTKLSEFNDDVGYVTTDDLAVIKLDDLIDVDTHSSRLTDSNVLTYKAYLDKWVPAPIDSVITDLTTTQVDEGTNLYFTEARANAWAEDYLPTVNLRTLQDVVVEDNQEGTVLYFTESAWRARRLEELNPFSVDNLADVIITQPLNNFEVLTYNNNSWRAIAFEENPNFTFNRLNDTIITDPEEGHIPVYDANNRKWVNKALDLSSLNVSVDVSTIVDNLSLNSLPDVNTPTHLLRDGAVLTYSASGGVWSPSVLTAGVTSINGFNGVVNITTASIPESGNLYFTTERVDQRLNQRLSTITLSDILPLGEDGVERGDVLYFDGSSWAATNVSTLNISTSDLSDFILPDTISNGQVLVNQNGVWTAADLPSTQLADIPDNTLLGNISGDIAQPTALTFGTGFSFSGSTVNVDSGGVALGLTLVSVKTNNYTALNGQLIPCDTSAGSFNITCPTEGSFSVIDVIGNSPTTGFGVVGKSLFILPTSGKTVMGEISLELDIGAISPEFLLIGTDWRIINHG